MAFKMTEEGEGVRAARAAKRRYLRMTGLLLLGAIGIGLVMVAGTTAPGHLRPAVAIACVLAMVIFAPFAIRYSTRLSDEVDQMAMLKANSWGLYTYFIGQFGWMVLTAGGLVPPPNALVIYFATGIATLGCYVWFKIAQ